jgi:predicted metal-dependent hydrolase
MAVKQKTVYHHAYGEVLLKRKTGVRRMSVSVRPLEAIRVTVPYSLGFDAALKFLDEKDAWIRKQLEKIALVEKSRTVFTENTVFTTRDHRLVFSRTSNREPSGRIDHNSIRVYVPNAADIKDELIQKFIRRLIEEAWRLEAGNYLPARLRYLSGQHGFQYNRVSVRNNRSRWGSCSAKNNINLNLHLMRLPDELIDYVLLHELVHTRYKNHSNKFWEALERCMDNARLMDRELKKYRTEIY